MTAADWPIELADVLAARERLRPHLPPTPLHHHPALDAEVGHGIRVLVNGAWGFAATNALNEAGVAEAARRAAAIARANSRIQTEPVRLAPVKGVGEDIEVTGEAIKDAAKD